MAERDRQLEREEAGTSIEDMDLNGLADGETSGEFDVGEDATEHQSNRGSKAGVGSRARQRLGSVVSGRSLVVALAVITAGALVLGGILPLGSLGNLLGIALGAFVYGLATDTRHYTESTVAGTAVGGVLAVVGNIVLSLTGIGLPLVAVGAIGGGLSGLVGHYFGRDLRDGLTQEI